MGNTKQKQKKNVAEEVITLCGEREIVNAFVGSSNDVTFTTIPTDRVAKKRPSKK